MNLLGRPVHLCDKFLRPDLRRGACSILTAFVCQDTESITDEVFKFQIQCLRYGNRDEKQKSPPYVRITREKVKKAVQRKVLENYWDFAQNRKLKSGWESKSQFFFSIFANYREKKHLEAPITLRTKLSKLKLEQLVMRSS